MSLPDPDRWHLAGDEPMFTLPGTHWGVPQTCRLQTLRSEQGDVFFVGVQYPGEEGAGLVNRAELFLEHAWATHAPDRPSPPPLLAVLLMGAERRVDLVLVEGELRGGKVSAGFRYPPFDPDLQAVFDCHAALDRGDDYTPHASNDPVFVTRWSDFEVRSLPTPHPFRSMCMKRPRSRLTRWAARHGHPTVRPGARCCWYHQGDWELANQLLREALRQIEAEGQLPPVSLSGIETWIGRFITDPWILQAAASLIDDPIAPTNDAAEYVNGQHRSMAMIDQGVPTTVVQFTYLQSDAPDYQHPQYRL